MKPHKVGRGWPCKDGSFLERADAKHDISFVVQDLDIKAAKSLAKAGRHQCEVCAIALRAAVVFGATEIRIFERTALIAHLGPDGVRRMYRYILDANARRIVHKVDAGDFKSVHGQLIRFGAPTPGRTMERNRERARLLRLGKLEKRGSRPNYPKHRAKPGRKIMHTYHGRAASSIVNSIMRHAPQ